MDRQTTVFHRPLEIGVEPADLPELKMQLGQTLGGFGGMRVRLMGEFIPANGCRNVPIHARRGVSTKCMDGAIHTGIVAVFMQKIDAATANTQATILIPPANRTATGKRFSGECSPVFPERKTTSKSSV